MMKLIVFASEVILLSVSCDSFMLRTKSHTGRISGGDRATQALEPMGGDLISRCQQQHLEMSMLELGVQEEPANGPQSSAAAPVNGTVEDEDKKDPEVNDIEAKNRENQKTVIVKLMKIVQTNLKQQLDWHMHKWKVLIILKILR